MNSHICCVMSAGPKVSGVIHLGRVGKQELLDWATDDLGGGCH